MPFILSIIHDQTMQGGVLAQFLDNPKITQRSFEESRCRLKYTKF